MLIVLILVLLCWHSPTDLGAYFSYSYQSNEMRICTYQSKNKFDQIEII